MMKLVAVGLGGLIGALGRYGLSGLVHRWLGGSFPYGTLAVNAAGCLLIGALMYLVEERSLLTPNLRLFLGIGVLGAFTTFSTFGYETVELLRDRQIWYAFMNVAGNVVLGIAAVIAGYAGVRAAGF
ncbi:MAG: fluoride efflux transporter CrcB [Thermodesulfovibrionales bacterium]